MLELYLSELRRFRLGAAIYATASLLLLILLSQILDVANAPRELHIVMLMLYMLSGLGFGLYQFGSYRQPSRWIWLMHRPLHASRILAALVLASSTLIVLAMALPLFLFVWTQDHYTYRVVDLRHYGGAACLVLATFGAWLGGAYMMLHRSRWAFVVLVLPILLTMHVAAWDTVLLLSVACDALLLLLVATVFRPNRQTAGDAAATLASAIPLQASFYLAVLWGGSMLFQVGQMALGVHPLNGDHVPRGGFTETIRLDARETLQAALREARDPRAAGWAAGLTRPSTGFVGPYVRQYGVRDVVTTWGTPGWRDEDGILWTFSHDRMMYHGLNQRTRELKGWFGTGGVGDEGRFDSQPLPITDNRGHRYLVNVRDLYEEQDAGRRLRHVLHVDGVEQIGGGVAVLGKRTVLLTNRRLVLIEDDGRIDAPRVAIPLPVPFGDLARVEAADVADGTLLSIVSGNRRNEGVEAASQRLYLVDRAGAVTQLAQREFAHDFPLLFEHKDWWLSPVWQALVSLPELLVEKGLVPDDGADRFAPLLRPRPPAAWAAAAVLALVSLLGAAWWTRNDRMSARQRLAWCAASLLLGLPAWLALMVLQPREPGEEAFGRRPAAAPATS